MIQGEVLYNKDDNGTTEQVDANDEYYDEEPVNVIAGDREDIPDDADVPHHQPFDSENTKYEVALISFICEAPEYRRDIWESCLLDDIKHRLSTAEMVHKSFVVKELEVLIKLARPVHAQRMKKHDLVNIVAEYYGDHSKLRVNISPSSLKSITVKYIRSWPIEAINVAYAQLHFLEEFSQWEYGNDFQGSWTLCTNSGTVYNIPQWYAHSANENERRVDTTHYWSPSRLRKQQRCCSAGRTGMGLSSKAWLKVAEHNKENKTGLSEELVKELRDKQSNAYAKTTFSQEVQDEMTKSGDLSEAEWCNLIRDWYEAVDGAAMSPDKLLEAMLNMRNKLLQYLRVGQFPPPGLHVAGMPMAQYEGLLTNIDRKLQLYNLVHQGTYNQGAISSLDSENLFGAFQVIIISCYWAITLIWYHWGRANCICALELGLVDWLTNYCWLGR